MKSFNSFIFYEESIRDIFNKTIESFKEQVEKSPYSIYEIERNLNRSSEFGYISRNQFVDYLY